MPMAETGHTAGKAGSGRLFGVGVGPGDPELMTVKAREAIAAADVVSYPNAQHGRSVARRIAACCMREDHIELPLAFPVTTEMTDHPGGYEAALEEFYDDAADAIAAHLDAGRDVAVLCEGDPFFYGSYMYLHERLQNRYATTVIPGVTGFSAAAASAGTPLVKRDDVFMALPGTLSAQELAMRVRSADAAVVMKLGRTFAKVRDAVEAAGAGERGVYVERASSEQERIAPLRDVEGEVPYMSLVLLPTRDRDEAQGGFPRVGGCRRARPGRTRLADTGSARRARRGGRADRLRHVSRARAAAPRAAPPCERQPRRGGARAPRARARGGGCARGGRLLGRPRDLRDGGRGARGARGRIRRSRMSRCASCRASPRCRPRPRASARRWATISA